MSLSARFLKYYCFFVMLFLLRFPKLEGHRLGADGLLQNRGFLELFVVGNSWFVSSQIRSVLSFY